jgi:hypothetical protein
VRVLTDIQQEQQISPSLADGQRPDQVREWLADVDLALINDVCSGVAPEWPGTRLSLRERPEKRDDVRLVQGRLNELRYGLEVDGHYGPGTRDAVADFQQRTGVESDGIVGPGTWVALFGQPCPEGVACPLDNGIDVTALRTQIAAQASNDRMVDAADVTCETVDRMPIELLLPGEFFTCTVMERQFVSVFVTVPSPHFEFYLAE